MKFVGDKERTTMPSKVKKPPKPADAPARDTREVDGAQPPSTPSAELIRIADTDSRLRAIMVLGETREPHSCFTDFRFLVTREQPERLRSESIPFEIVS
jgi:hypothetical protein